METTNYRKKIDADWVDKEARKVDIDTIAHSNVREIGAECPPNRTGRDML